LHIDAVAFQDDCENEQRYISAVANRYVAQEVWFLIIYGLCRYVQ